MSEVVSDLHDAVRAAVESVVGSDRPFLLVVDDEDDRAEDGVRVVGHRMPFPAVLAIAHGLLGDSLDKLSSFLRALQQDDRTPEPTPDPAP